MQLINEKPPAYELFALPVPSLSVPFSHRMARARKCPTLNKRLAISAIEIRVPRKDKCPLEITSRRRKSFRVTRPSSNARYHFQKRNKSFALKATIFDKKATLLTDVRYYRYDIAFDYSRFWQNSIRRWNWIINFKSITVTLLVGNCSVPCEPMIVRESRAIRSIPPDASWPLFIQGSSLEPEQRFVEVKHLIRAVIARVRVLSVQRSGTRSDVLKIPAPLWTAYGHRLAIVSSKVSLLSRRKRTAVHELLALCTRDGELQPRARD